MSKASKFFAVRKVRAETGTVGRLDIFGNIDAASYWGDEMTPSLLVDQLNALGKIDSLDVHVFSNGGDVFAGLAIYSILRQRREPVHVYVEGIAASIATVITCAGDRVYMDDSAMMMLHNPFAALFFETLNAEDARGLADELDSIRRPMLQTYQRKTGKTEAEIIAVLDGPDGRGTWFTAAEAIAFGLADEYTPVEKKPHDAVARLGPAQLRWRNHTMDLSDLPDAAERTKRIGQQPRGGAKKMAGFFRRLLGKKPAAKKRRAEVVLVDTVCPYCNADILLNPETGEIVIAGVPNSDIEERDTEHLEIEEGLEARRLRSNTRAQLFSIVCPVCGEEFVWDTDINEDGEEGEPVIETEPMGTEIPEDPDLLIETNEDVPEELPAEAAYRRGVLAERQRMLALDDLAQTAPGMEAVIDAGKRSGSSIAAMNRNVLKAVSRNPRSAGRRQLGARERDAERSGVNGLRNPKHYSERQRFASLVEQEIAKRR